ncbi:hypothetical protein BpHYR1_001182 [Brachionus plicatilis]|uniref:Tc1-like transposase DDE domain-containing protein n=1 Tax=Brachionus plicatilis TaxID=10195 RepID=A0A3M7SMM4_BRAPC|nr:hypothetical protein BpHYR1_001182 [Brachionus plicatilis]
MPSFKYTFNRNKAENFISFIKILCTKRTLLFDYFSLIQDPFDNGCLPIHSINRISLEWHLKKISNQQAINYCAPNDKPVICRDKNGTYKGLINICKELREKLLDHQAFNNENTLLQKLAKDNGFKVLFCPKYHCKLNPIEGLWCFLKANV